jgi:hypothetical protein
MFALLCCWFYRIHILCSGWTFSWAVMFMQSRKKERERSTLIWSCKAYKADKFFNLLMKESIIYTACGKMWLSSWMTKDIRLKDCSRLVSALYSIRWCTCHFQNLGVWIWHGSSIRSTVSLFYAIMTPPFFLSMVLNLREENVGISAEFAWDYLSVCRFRPSWGLCRWKHMCICDLEWWHQSKPTATNTPSLEACYDSIVDEPWLRCLQVSPW